MSFTRLVINFHRFHLGKTWVQGENTLFFLVSLLTSSEQWGVQEDQQKSLQSQSSSPLSCATLDCLLPERSGKHHQLPKKPRRAASKHDYSFMKIQGERQPTDPISAHSEGRKLLWLLCEGSGSSRRDFSKIYNWHLLPPNGTVPPSKAWIFHFNYLSSIDLNYPEESNLWCSFTLW